MASASEVQVEIECYMVTVIVEVTGASPIVEVQRDANKSLHLTRTACSSWVRRQFTQLVAHGLTRR